MSNKDYQVLTLKYRPQNLDELWIQEHIKITLKNAIENNRVAHAFIFTGPRGVGKTTTARILAKSLNCVHGPTVKPCQKCSVCQEITVSQNMDVLEIDGASNRGIDQVRELRENVKFMPTSCRYKIYIIDEVHMLTQEAFNALLKTLEEPPPHVKFIFATTAIQKVPTTILSRCQRFDFRKARINEIVERLNWICKKEHINISEDALLAIGKRADGSIRDAEGMLDQLRVFKSNKIELKDVEELLGIISSEIFFDYTEILLNYDQTSIIEFINKVFSSGYDFIEFFYGLLEYLRILLMLKINIDINTLGITSNFYAKLKYQVDKFKQEDILVIMQYLADNENVIKNTTEPKILFEIFSLNIINMLKTVKSLNKNNNNIVYEIWHEISNFLSMKLSVPLSVFTNVSLQINNDIIELTSTKDILDYINMEKQTINDIFKKKLGSHIKIKISEENTANKISSNIDNIKNIQDINQDSVNDDIDQLFKTTFPKGRKLK